MVLAIMQILVAFAHARPTPKDRPPPAIQVRPRRRRSGGRDPIIADYRRLRGGVQAPSWRPDGAYLAPLPDFSQRTPSAVLSARKRIKAWLWW